MPRPIADAIAHFVAERARSSQLPSTPEGQDRGESYLAFLRHYQQAVQEHRQVTADNLAHTLLEIALQHQDAPGFRPAWREWQQVGPALEDDPV